MEETRKLARFVSQLSFEDLPGDVVEKTKRLILDQLGCQIAGATLPWSRSAFDYISENGVPKSESTIVHYGRKTSAQDAAFANACFGGGFLGDDTDSVCHGHLGAIIIPVALAMGEREGISGKEFINAVVAGYETASRIGAASPMAESRGYHPGPLFGPFGAAVCVGKILKFDPEKMTDVLGIAGSQCSGLMEYAKSGGNVNRLHNGFAAYNGARSALLAQRGFRGPAAILEGERGFIRAFSGQAALEEITNDLGTRFRVMIIDLKSHCCCGTSGSTLDSISKITGKVHIDPEEIDKVTAYVTPFCYALTGSVIKPESISSAQFGGRFGIALRLIKGSNTLHEYTEENLTDPDILKLVDKIDYLVDEDLNHIPNSDYPARITLRLKNGKTYEAAVHAAKGSILNPLTKEEVYEKFRRLTVKTISEIRANEIIEYVENLDTQDDVQGVIKLLALNQRAA